MDLDNEYFWQDQRYDDALHAELDALRAERDRLRKALQDLVDLKDAPRDSVYLREKPKAWDAARAALAAPADHEHQFSSGPIIDRNSVCIVDGCTLGLTLGEYDAQQDAAERED